MAGLSLALPASLLILLFITWLSPTLTRWMLVFVLFLVLKFLSDSPGNPVEWLKSATLVFTNISCLIGIGMIVTSPRILRIDSHTIDNFLTFLIWFLTLHGLFLVMQYIMFNSMGNFALLNPLGQFSPPGPNPVSTDVTPYNPLLQVVKRPNGLAWEPSTAAVWQLVGLALLLSHRNRLSYYLLKAFAMIAGVVVTSSIIGYIVLLAMLSHHIIFLRIWNRGFALLSYIPMALFVLLALPATINVLGFSDRFAEVSRIGSSGYIRFTAPLQLIQQRGFSIFGSENLGSRSYREEIIFHSLSNEMGGIANMYFEAFVYFGLFGVAAYLAIIGRIAGQNTRHPSMLVLLLLFPVFGGYLFNVLAFYPIFLTLIVHCLIISRDHNLGKSPYDRSPIKTSLQVNS